jgi:hypothetical protein
VQLPRKTSEITRITGIPKNKVKTYLYRRRRYARRMMADIIKYARLLPLPLLDREGVPLTTLSCKKIQFRYDYWTLKAQMIVQDAQGNNRFVEVESLERLHKTVREALALIIPSTSESSQEP